MSKPKNYEDGEYLYANILGTGQYQFIGADSGKTEHKHPIGFVRPKPPSQIILLEPRRLKVPQNRKK